MYIRMILSIEWLVELLLKNLEKKSVEFVKSSNEVARPQSFFDVAASIMRSIWNMTFNQEIPLLSTHLFGTTKLVEYSAKDYQVGFLEPPFSVRKVD